MCDPGSELRQEGNGEAEQAYYLVDGDVKKMMELIYCLKLLTCYVKRGTFGVWSRR